MYYFYVKVNQVKQNKNFHKKPIQCAKHMPGGKNTINRIFCYNHKEKRAKSKENKILCACTTEQKN